MANSDLIKGAGALYASQATDMGASFSKSLEKGIAKAKQITQAKKQEKAVINNRTANFINKLNSTVDVTNLDGAQQQAVTNFLVEGRNEYASLAGQVAKMDPDSGGYMDAVSRMNDIQMSFQTLAGNIKMYKKDRVSFLEDFDNGMLSEGNEVNTLGEVSNIYTEGSNFSVSAGGGLQFFDEATGLSKNYSDIQKPFLKDFGSADAIMQMNESLYSSGKSLKGARRNMIEQKLKNIISKGGRDTLMSLASDDFIMEGGLGLQDPMLFEPENQDALKQAVLDGYMNVLDASAAQGAADKAPKASNNGGLGFTKTVANEIRTAGPILEAANAFINMDAQGMADTLNYKLGKSNYMTTEEFKILAKEQEGFDEAVFNKRYGKYALVKFDGDATVPVPFDIKNPKKAFELYLDSSDLGGQARNYFIENFKLKETPDATPDATPGATPEMSDEEKAQELINKYAKS
jgi:hypothetical protein